MFKIDFIIPQYNDARIIRAINSIANHNDSELFRIIVCDGGDNVSLQNEVSKILRAQDIHLKKKDFGIFDAINNGIQLVEAEWTGWLGADDLISEFFSVKDMMKQNKEINYVSYTTIMFNDRECEKKVERIYKPCKNKYLRKLGMHLPHFSTYVRTEILKTLRFDISHGTVADIPFFINLENNYDGIIIDGISTYMSIGGVSNSNFLNTLRSNYNLLNILAKKMNLVKAMIFIFIKILYKLSQKTFIKKKLILKYI